MKLANISNGIKLEDSLVHSESEFKDTSKTKLDISLFKSSNGNKLNNFLKALSVMKLKDIRLSPKSLKSKLDQPIIYNTTEYDKNISEYSTTNANFSREENALRYLNNPVEKNIAIRNNEVIKRKRTPHSSSTAHFPYKMDFITESFPKKLKEIKEDILEEAKHEVVSKLNIFYSKNKCSTTYDSSRGQAKTSPKVKPFDGIDSNIKKVNLDDLDEDKDINLVDYQIEGKIFPNKNLNISNLDVFNIKSQIEMSINNNSKILIVDSVCKYSDKENEISARKYNNTNTLDLTHDKFNSHFFSNSINLQKCFQAVAINNTTIEMLTSQKKRVRTKYFKSEIFESNTKEKLDIKQKKEALDKSNRINANLIDKFDEANFTERKNEQEFDIDCMDLITENDIVQTDSNNTSRQIRHNSFINNIYITPLNKIRNSNLIIDERYKDESNFNLNKTQDDNNESFFHTVYDIDFINNLLSSENIYRPYPKYLDLHPKIDSLARLILLDWMMQLCEEFAFKRDTFHYAVNYIDRYLSYSSELEKQSLQLVGVTALTIAAKFEEIQIPKVEEYLNSTDNAYTNEQLMQAEKLLLKTLKWQILPTTLNTWLNWYLCQWDLFIDTITDLKDILAHNGLDPVYFKKADEYSYTYYRQITQLIDLYVLDYHSLKFQPRHLVAGSIFTVLALVYNLDYKRLRDIINRRDNYIVVVYSEFLEQSFNFNINEIMLIETIEYCLKFINFEFNYNLPLIVQSHQDSIENVYFYFYLFITLG